MNIAGMDLNLLVAFEAIYRERNVSRAAERIGLAQPSLSNALSRLRHVFQDELFIRSPQGMMPTARAEEIAPPVIEALAQMRGILAGPGAFDPAHVQQDIVIAAADYFELTILPAFMQYVQTHAPGVRIRTRFLEKNLLVDQLDRREVDLAFGIAGDVPERVKCQSILREQFVCLVREGHKLLKTPLTMDSFLETPQVLFSLRGDARGIVDDELAKQGLKRNVALSVSHFISLAFIIKDSDMIATVPSRMANIMSMYLPVKIIPAPLELPEFTLSLMWSQTMHNDPLHRWLREAVAVSSSSTQG